MSDTQHVTESASAPDTFESRVGSLIEAATAEDNEVLAQRDAELSAPPVEQAPAPQPDVEKARAERKARLAALRAEETQRVDRKAPLAEQDQATRRAEEAERQLRELQAQLAGRIDPESLDEAAFFQLAQRAKVQPQKLGEWIRDSMSNPERLAIDAATKALDPRLQAIQERAERAERQVQEFLQQQQQREAEAAEQRAAAEFVSSITEASAPRSAAFLKAFGNNEFLKVAHSAAATLSPGAGQQALLDSIEDVLDQFAAAFSQAPSSGQRNPTPNPGAAKPTVISNSVAQQRASVVGEDDFASLPFEERVRRVRSSA